MIIVEYDGRLPSCATSNLKRDATCDDPGSDGCDSFDCGLFGLVDWDEHLSRIV